MPATSVSQQSYAQRSAMLWTGGKDSSLALSEATENGYHVCCLATFAPPDAGFLAHPLPFIALQAEALALPHCILTVREPFDESYETQLRWLRDEMNVTAVITGDIAEVNGNPNWICERGHRIGMHVHRPLWGRDRLGLLQQMLDRKLKVRFSCVDTHWLEGGWIGRELDEQAIAELRVIRQQTGLDLCGEEGEYHTLVTDGPQFTRAVEILSYSERKTDSLAYMEIHESKLSERAT